MTSQEKLLWAAFERIKAAPELYDQRTYGMSYNCGTAGCLAYHICVAAGVKRDGFSNRVSVQAAKLMGFGALSEQYVNLFGVPDSYRHESFTVEQRVEWLENHIRQWVEKYCKGTAQ